MFSSYLSTILKTLAKDSGIPITVCVFPPKAWLRKSFSIKRAKLNQEQRPLELEYESWKKESCTSIYELTKSPNPEISSQDALIFTYYSISSWGAVKAAMIHLWKTFRFFVICMTIFLNARIQMISSSSLRSVTMSKHVIWYHFSKPQYFFFFFWRGVGGVKWGPGQWQMTTYLAL